MTVHRKHPGAYPVDYIENAVIPSIGGHPKNIMFLTADAFGVLPPISKLTPEQAMYHFLSGYTAKLAGTESGMEGAAAGFFHLLWRAVYAVCRPRSMRRCWGGECGNTDRNAGW